MTLGTSSHKHVDLRIGTRERVQRHLRVRRATSVRRALARVAR